ncbi:flagellar hook-associated protein FlgL [Citricoccus sp. I39-566]|uniref:flagellar hook-associated protein FlgL n=1 Tax=Citricoccus sp. I39-566 TaxID=3073268 RepID=UPI00286A104F|nr:flagellar hook-associated protein FlgL [Citricoccus sp. I39-566]WMY77993.1 flagellar hook-associated protein FlgL [Citricoccus sp. I39-566]
MTMMHRVTSSMTAATTRANLQESAKTLAELQNKAASRQAISRPSDDPAGTRTAMAARAEIARTTQYERNLQNADTWMRSIDNALQSGLDIMARIQDLTLAAANATVNQAGRDASAAEVDQLRTELLSVANTQVLGRNVFAGTSAESAAYVEGTPPTWNGTPGADVERRISDSTTIQVDVPGEAAFGTIGQGSVFEVLTKLSETLRSGGDLSGSIGTLENSRQQMSDALTASGARHATVGRTLQATQTRLTELEATRTSTEEADLAESAVELQMQQLNYQAALAVSAQALQTSLLDYLR